MPPGGIAWLDFCFIAQENPPQSLWTCQMSQSQLVRINGVSPPPLSVRTMLLPWQMWMGNNHLLLLMQQRCKSYNQCLLCVCPVCIAGGIGSAWLVFRQQSENLPYIRNKAISVCRGLIMSSPLMAKLDFHWLYFFWPYMAPNQVLAKGYTVLHLSMTKLHTSGPEF